MPSAISAYPRCILTRRPDVVTVDGPPVCEIRVDRVHLDASKVAAYAAACGYADADARDGRIPAAFPHVLATPLHLRIMAMRAFPLRPMGLIHLANVISMPGELRTGMTVDVVVAARNYRKTETGLAFDMDTELLGAGRPLWRETCVLLSRWPESVQRPATRPPRPPRAPKSSVVLAEFAVDRATVWRYARVSGDVNPIHLNDRAARFFGLRGAIAHGMWSLARSLAQQPVAVPEAQARLETQFLTPVQLPARVCVKSWLEEGVERRALCDVRTGRVHMYTYWKDAATA